MRIDKGNSVDVSLVICTRNRVSQLERCLGALEQLECDHRWEVIIVDNGSTDATAECLARAAQRSAITFIAEPRPGLARARNMGIRKAKGRWVAFTDDDCYPAPDYLSRVIDCFGDETISYMGGRTLLFDTNDAKICIQEKAERELVEPRTFVGPSLIQGMNFAAERRALIEIGGFDERLGAGSSFFSAEDTDIMGRLSWTGRRGLYDPTPTVYHHHQRKDLADIDKLVRGYSIGMGAYLLKFTRRSDSRAVYLKHWCARVKRGSRNRTFRELRGAFRFAAKYSFRRGGIWGGQKWLDSVAP
jgi:glycosyltransferase involved in cell wall biosynthesis